MVRMAGENSVSAGSISLEYRCCTTPYCTYVIVRAYLLLGHLPVRSISRCGFVDFRQTEKNRFRYSPALRWLRYGVLTVFVIALVAGWNTFVILLAPYSAYGRMASSLLAPFWQWGNNLMAYFAERAESYASTKWMCG